MSRQIILRAVFAILIGFSFTNLASAQLKPSGISNKVLVDLTVIDGLSAGRSPSQAMTINGTEGELLKPPSKMPRSHFLVKRPTPKNLRKLSRIKLKPIVKSRKKRFKRVNASKKAKPLRTKSRVLKLRRPKTKTIKSQNINKSSPIPKQDHKRPIKLTKVTPKEPVINKPNLAPAPKAFPKAPIKILPAPPPKPIIGKTTAKTKLTALKASRSKNTDQQSRSKLLIFNQGDNKLTKAAKKTLDNLSAKLKVEPSFRMQLKAYAGEPNLSASRARRLSLSRALSARSYLIKKGIRSTRIDVRALGNKTSVGEPNRVELKLIKN